jgi:hypothetical protein
VGELTRSESVSGGISSIAVEISHALGESLSEIRDQYFRGSNKSDRVERVLAEEQDYLWEDLQEQERFAENSRKERDVEMRSYHEDNMF